MASVYQRIVAGFTKDLRQSEEKLKDLLNSEIIHSNEINTRLNRELQETSFSLELKHAKGVKSWEDERDKQINEISYVLADIRESIETEAVEK